MLNLPLHVQFCVMLVLSSWIVKLAIFLSADWAVNRNMLDCSITWEANWEHFPLRLQSMYSLKCLSILTVTKIGDCDLWRRARLQIKKKVQVISRMRSPMKVVILHRRARKASLHSCFSRVSVAFFLTNCCDSWPLCARRRKCRVGAVQASDSCVSELVTCCPSCPKASIVTSATAEPPIFFDLQARATSEIAVASFRDLENRETLWTVEETED